MTTTKPCTDTCLCTSEAAEIQRLRAGEDSTPRTPDAEPTPGQWIKSFLDATPDERLAAAAGAIRNAGIVHDHLVRNTAGELTHLRRRVRELEAALDQEGTA